MKLYVFNSPDEWDCFVNHAVVAESEADAVCYFLESAWLGDEEEHPDYVLTVHDVGVGLVLEADGYDDAKMIVLRKVDK